MSSGLHSPTTASQSFHRYRIEHELGRGASGIVYAALDTALERPVALKTVSTAGLDAHEKQDLLTRFRREATAAARLTHPNIVTVFDFGHEEETAFIVMERVTGSSLAALVAAQQRLDLARVLRLMKQLLAGLEVAHAHGIIHRDIKPSNLLLLPGGQLKIADFGVARLESSTVTRAGTILGTPSYMAPEQLAGQQVDRRADLFSAGVILYELLTGQRPFQGDSTYSVIYQVLHDEPKLPSELDRAVPKWIDSVVQKALAKDPAQRFQTAEEFAQALQAAAAEGPAQSETQTQRLSPGAARAAAAIKPKPEKPAARANPAWLGLAGLVALGLVALGWWASVEPPEGGEQSAVAKAVPLPINLASSGRSSGEKRTVPAEESTAASEPLQKIEPQNSANVGTPTPSSVASSTMSQQTSPVSRSAKSAERGAPPGKAGPALRPKFAGSTPPEQAAGIVTGGAAGPQPLPAEDWRVNGALRPQLRLLPVAALRRAAEGGDARAMNQLANAFREGRGVDRDLREAAVWFEKSAAAGNPNAMLSLAAMYREGQGVARDTSRALELLKRAADLGNPRALVLLAGLYLKGEGVVANDAKAVEHLRTAANLGERAAFTHLAYLHESGRGVTKDPAEALRYYRRAAELGDPRARERLRELGEPAPEVLPPPRRFLEGRRPLRADIEARAAATGPGGDALNSTANSPTR